MQAFNPTSEVLHLYYEMLVSRAEQNQVPSNVQEFPNIKEQNLIKGYVIAFIAFLTFQEKNSNDEENLFVQDIVYEKVNFQQIRDLVTSSCIYNLIDCLCSSNLPSDNKNGRMIIDLFNFTEELGQSFLSRFATPDRIAFYNSFMHHINRYIVQKCPEIKELLDFKPYK